jgi:hypothetical protein
MSNIRDGQKPSLFYSAIFRQENFSLDLQIKQLKWTKILPIHPEEHQRCSAED